MRHDYFFHKLWEIYEKNYKKNIWKGRIVYSNVELKDQYVYLSLVGTCKYANIVNDRSWYKSVVVNSNLLNIFQCTSNGFVFKLQVNGILKDVICTRAEIV